MPLPPRCRILIFDLGDVLFSWSPVTSTSISPKLLKQLLSSTIWQDYECGRLAEDECYRLVGDKFSLDPGEVGRAINDARESLQPDDTFIRFIRELQTEAQGALRIFAMSNISAPDYAVARGKPTDWSIFERVFTSADAGMRKPDLCFYKFVLNEIKAEPSSVVFVDDRFENVLAARSLGINGIVFDDVERVRQALRNLVSDPVTRGVAFLESRAGHLESETNLGNYISENFAQLLILEATRNKKLVNYVHHTRTWNFFRGNRYLSKRQSGGATHTSDATSSDQPVFTTAQFPADMDTTSIGLTVTQPDDHVVQSVLDEMLHYLTGDGITMTYFDAERPRTDPIVCLNVLTLFYSRGRGHELANTLEWVLGVLEHRAYLDGTRYYETAECFLFFATRLLHKLRDEALHARLTRLLRERVLERAGCSGDALALAMRVLVGAAVGLRMERDLAAMLPLQCEDGGWGPGWIYKYGSSDIKIGNRGLTTALALNAIAALDAPQSQQALVQEQELTLEREKAPLKREGGCTVEIVPALHPRLLVASAQHDSSETIVTSSSSSSSSSSSPPPSLPLLPVPKQSRIGIISVRAFARSIFAFLYPRN